jgi:sugar phosphate isomerase/epimerase
MEGVGIEAHVEAAAVCGFDAVSLRPRHVRRWLDGAAGRTLRGLVATLGRHGIAVAELDPVMGWHDPSRWPGDLLPGDVVDDLDLAAALGATAVTALVGPGEPWDHGAGIDGLGVLAEPPWRAAWSCSSSPSAGPGCTTCAKRRRSPGQWVVPVSA